jgi:hypothetical protein
LGEAVRGWKCVGDVTTWFGCDLFIGCYGDIVEGDVLVFRPRMSGFLRTGIARVEEAWGGRIVLQECVSLSVIGVTKGDLVFKATVLGEDAFKPLSAVEQLSKRRVEYLTKPYPQMTYREWSDFIAEHALKATVIVDRDPGDE